VVAKISTIKRKLRTGEKMGFSERARAVAEQRAKVMGKTAIASQFKQAKATLRRKHNKNGTHNK
jgi:hypothetical protein